ncbi:CPT1B palmitoyltransferase, partial [Glaucidium brasilianum]|nr:CPT1B palmitoyltransferase [Glaucidium brasilianum]
MAEAHQAVAFQFTVTPEGLDFHLSREAVRQLYLAGISSWKKRLVRAKNSFLTGVYPASPSSWMVVVMATASSFYCQVDPSLGIIARIRHCLPESRLLSYESRTMVSAALFSTGVWLSAVLLFRQALKLLLSYHGWMFEPHGKMSRSTKIWVALVKVLCGRKPLLYSFQTSLPKLPVPSVEATVTRYLESVRPLMDDEKFSAMEALAKEFKDKTAPRLQKYLILKSWWTTNYVSDWWEQYIYLRGRSPLMVNSNYYAMDFLYVTPSHIQAARAGNVVHAILLLGTPPWAPSVVHPRTGDPHLDTPKLGTFFGHPGAHDAHWAPTIGQPQLGTSVRHPKAEDPPLGTPIWAPPVGDPYRAPSGGEPPFRRPPELGTPRAGHPQAGDPHWAPPPPFGDPQLGTPKPGVSGAARWGGSVWGDTGSTGAAGGWMGQGWGAQGGWGVVPHAQGHLPSPQFMLATDKFQLGYTEGGHCRGEPNTQLAPPQRLQWDLPQECRAAIEGSYRLAKALADDVDFCCFQFTQFGKGLIKRCRTSPDAFIQISLQLAHFRDKGRFCLTYEASMTRLFREGRTETVRSCTAEAIAFVRSMADPRQTRAERQRLFKLAAERHQLLYRLAMTGAGIDRHLFCLYVVSRYLGVQSPFLAQV